MSVNEIIDYLQRSARSADPVGVAVLLEAWRSAPRRPGARFAAGYGESTAGSISAGCVEADLREHLALVAGGAPARVVRYGVSDADAAAIGLSCGGEIEVLVTAHDPGDPVWQRLVTSVAAGEEVVLLTRAGDRNPGRQLLLTADGEQVGTLGSAGVDRAAATEGAVALESRAMPRLTTLPDGDRVFIEPMLRPRRLFAVGATPIARALARLGGIVDVPVTIVDPREPLAREAQAEGLEPVIAAPGVAFESARIGPGDGVAVLAHDMRLDLAGLRAALDGRAGYIGLLGGRRTQKTRRDQLLEQGVDPEAVEAIRGPIGLDIGAESPAEIALSILSEVLLHWNRPGTLRPDRP